ncbi:MAG: hypothetical protein NVS9B15_05630 [Acidobacteriaceae bacterium]
MEQILERRRSGCIIGPMHSDAGRYRLGPFLIGSEIPIPELSLLDVTDPGEPNAWIRLGNAPEKIDNVVANESRWWASETEYLQRVPHVARFLVRNGREIIVEPCPEAPPADIRAYLLAPIFGQLCFQSGRYALHASSVRVDDGVVAFLGNSGDGKSTLAAHLERHGFSIISDDTCLLETSTGSASEIRVIPVAPALKLWPSALQHLGASAAGLPRVWSQEEKFRMRIRELNERLPLRKIIFLEWEEDLAAKPVMEPVGGIASISRLLRFMHFEYLMKPTGRQAECFQLCGELLRQAKTYVLRRPKNFERMGEVIETLEQQLRGDSD